MNGLAWWAHWAVARCDRDSAVRQQPAHDALQLRFVPLPRQNAGLGLELLKSLRGSGRRGRPGSAASAPAVSVSESAHSQDHEVLFLNVSGLKALLNPPATNLNLTWNSHYSATFGTATVTMALWPGEIVIWHPLEVRRASDYTLPT